MAEQSRATADRLSAQLLVDEPLVQTAGFGFTSRLYRPAP